MNSKQNKGEIMNTKLYIHINRPVDFLQGDMTAITASIHEDMAEFGWVYIEGIDFNTASVDREKLTAFAINQMDEVESKLKAEFENKLTELKRQKQELLSITHNG